MDKEHLYIEMKDGTLKRVLILENRIKGDVVNIKIGFGYENLDKIKMD